MICFTPNSSAGDFCNSISCSAAAEPIFVGEICIVSKPILKKFFKD